MFSNFTLAVPHIIMSFTSWAWKDTSVNTLKPGQTVSFTDNIFKSVLSSENRCTQTRTSLKFVPMGPINDNLALVQAMAWHQPGDMPPSKPMMA